MSAPSSSSAAQVDLVIKSPSSETEAPLRLSVSLDGTIRDIKERLRQQHPDHPPPADQRLIFAGKLLADSSRTADVLRQRDVNEPQTFHLMLPIKTERSTSAAQTAASSASSATVSSSASTSASSASSSPAAPSASSSAAAAAAAATSATAAATAAATVAAAASSAGFTPPASAYQQLPGMAGWAGTPNAAAFALGAGSSPQQFAQAADMPFVAPPAAAYFYANGFPYALASQEYNGQPYVFVMPAPAAFAPPLPYVHAQLGTIALPHLGQLAPAAAAMAAQWRLGGYPAGVTPPHNAVGVEEQPAAAAAAAAENAAAAAGEGGRFVGQQAGVGGGGVGGGLGGGGLGGMAADADGEGEEGRTDAIKLLMKLAFFVYILGQDGTNQRLFLLLVGAVVIFLAQTGRLQFLNQLAAPQQPRPARPPPPAADDDAAADDGQTPREPTGGTDGDGEEAIQAAAEPESTAVGLMRDIESVVSAFFTSLIPTWRPYDADEQPPMAAGPGAM